MKEQIVKFCKEIEEKENIEILFAIENGSRAWRMYSRDSDYDVRFVYKRPMEKYLELNKQKDVINRAWDKDLKPCGAQGSLIDMSGFDIYKFAGLLSSSNPTTIEWLASDIIYYGKQDSVMKEFIFNNFNPTALYYHYKSSCRSNYEKYLRSKTLVTYKKYLYAMRGLVNAKWVVHKKTIPPIIFTEALGMMEQYIPKEIRDLVHEIIELKVNGNEKDIITNIVAIDNYIDEFLRDDSDAPEVKKLIDKHILSDRVKEIVMQTTS